MKNTTKRAYVLFAVLAAFFIGFVVLAVRFGLNGEKWATDAAINRKLETKVVPSLYSDGVIYDRSGKLLFRGDGKTHEWSSDRLTRMATLHVVGDGTNIGASFLSTSSEVRIKPTYTYDPVKGLQVEELRDDSDIEREIHLTIDAEVCKVAYQALADKSGNTNRSGKGTIAIYNYKTGDVYCLVSAPSYDVKTPGNVENGAYLNRFFQSVFTPGSTFKVVTSICAIENGMGDYVFEKCTGTHTVGGAAIDCYNKTAHGKNLTIQTGLNKSCNGIFSQLAVDLGADKLTATVQKLGFFNPVTVNGIETAPSIFTLDGASKHSVGWAGVGQYETRVNPCQMLMLMGAIANNGTAIIPNLIDSDQSRGQVNDNIRLDASTAKTLQTDLRSDVTATYGDSRFPGMEFCGKTGTAQVGNQNKSNAWFYGFSLRDDFPVAVVVCLDEGGMGGDQGVRAASKVMSAMYSAYQKYS